MGIPIYNIEDYLFALPLITPFTLVEAVSKLDQQGQAEAQFFEQIVKSIVRNIVFSIKMGSFSTLSSIEQFFVPELAPFVPKELSDYTTNPDYFYEYLITLWILTLVFAHEFLSNKDYKIYAGKILLYSLTKAQLLLPFIYKIMVPQAFALPQWNYEIFDSPVLVYGLLDFPNRMVVNIKDYKNVWKKKHSINKLKFLYYNSLGNNIFEENGGLFSKSIVIDYIKKFPGIEYDNTSFLDEIISPENKKHYAFKTFILLLFETIQSYIGKDLIYGDQVGSINDIIKSQLANLKKDFIKYDREKLEMVKEKKEKVESIIKACEISDFSTSNIKSNFNLMVPFSLQMYSIKGRKDKDESIFNSDVIKNRTGLKRCISNIILNFSISLYGHGSQMPAPQQINIDIVIYPIVFKGSLFQQMINSIYIQTDKPCAYGFGLGWSMYKAFFHSATFDEIFYTTYNPSNKETDPIINGIEDYKHITNKTLSFVHSSMKGILEYIGYNKPGSAKYYKPDYIWFPFQ